MFKNQSSFGSAPSQNSLQNNTPKVEEMPIHTMAEDLQDPTGSLARQNVSKERVPVQNMSEKQQSSPFLNPTVGTAEFSPKQAPENTPKNPVLMTTGAPQISIEEKSSKGTIITIIVAFLIIAVAGAGTYYFILTRKTETQELSDDSTETSEIIYEETQKPAIQEDFSSTTPNYLMLDTTAINQASFKDLLSKKAETIIKAETTVPIEFIVTDSQNNSLSFADFAKMTGMSLPTSIIENLQKDFSLYIVNDSSAPGIALAITALDTAKLKTELLKDESLLSSQLGAILLPEYEPSTVPFADHTFQGQAIRYQNLISPQKLAIDYAITKTQLIFATTKMTIESILDKLSSKNTIQTENIPQ